MFDILSGLATDGPWGYIAVALAAATPWVEILVVIPPAIALGMDPVGVGAVAFAGNLAPVAGIVACHNLIRRRRPASMDPGGRSRRRQRARRVLARYGVPGLTLLGPLITGVHLAALLALATGASRRAVLLWSGASLLAWTLGLTVATAAGVGVATERG